VDREVRSADEIRLELDRVARQLAVDGEGKEIEFHLPTLCSRPDGSNQHNWDVDAFCPEGADELALRAVEIVSDMWDLAEE